MKDIKNELKEGRSILFGAFAMSRTQNLLNLLYEKPYNKLKLIGVTGTDGKTYRYFSDGAQFVRKGNSGNAFLSFVILILGKLSYVTSTSLPFTFIVFNVGVSE